MSSPIHGCNRYIAFKVKGDTWWHLLDIKEGKFKDEGASRARRRKSYTTDCRH